MVAGILWPLLLGGPGAEIGIALAHFRSEVGAEVFGFKDLADFDFGIADVGIGAALDPFEGFFHGAHLPEPETGDELFGFAEGAVDYRAVLAGKTDALALGAR